MEAIALSRRWGTDSVGLQELRMNHIVRPPVCVKAEREGGVCKKYERQAKQTSDAIQHNQSQGMGRYCCETAQICKQTTC